MIFVDDREGSKELVNDFDDKFQAVLVRLDYGDFMFQGNGPDGCVEIGIERKVIGDLLGSITTGRLSGHQLPGLLKSYYRTYLIVEGMWRPGDNGIIEIFKGKWVPIRHGRRYKYTDILSYITTLEILTGVTVRFTRSKLETVLAIQSLHAWWGKHWSEHKSHMMMDKEILPQSPFATLIKPSLVKRIAVELPGVGPERAAHVAENFDTVSDMVEATPEDWVKIKWKTSGGRMAGFGKVTAFQAWKALHLK